MVDVKNSDHDSEELLYVFEGKSYSWKDYVFSRDQSFSKVNGFQSTESAKYFKKWNKQFIQDLFSSPEAIGQNSYNQKISPIIDKITNFEHHHAGYLEIELKRGISGTNTFQHHGNKISYEAGNNDRRAFDKKAATQMVALAVEAGLLDPMKLGANNFSGTAQEIKLLEEAHAKLANPKKSIMLFNLPKISRKTALVLAGAAIILTGSLIVIKKGLSNKDKNSLDKKELVDKDNSLETNGIDTKLTPLFTKRAPVTDVTETKKTVTKIATKKKAVQKNRQKTTTMTKTKEDQSTQAHKKEIVKPEQKVTQDSTLVELIKDKEFLEAELAYHQGILDQALEDGAPFWKLESLLEFVPYNRHHGGNLRINTRGPMFTPRNIINNKKIADMRDEEKIFGALAIASGYVALEDNLPLRKQAIKIGERLLKDLAVIDKLEQQKWERLDDWQEDIDTRNIPKQRRGYRKSRIDRSSERSISRQNYNIDKRRDKFINTFVHGRPNFFGKLFNYAVKQLEDKYEPIVFEQEAIIDGHKDRQGNGYIGLKKELKNVNKAITLRERELRREKRQARYGKTVGMNDSFQQSMDDLFGNNRDQDALAQNQNQTIQDYQETKELVTGFTGREMGDTFVLDKVMLEKPTYS